MSRRFTAVIGYVACIVAANILTARLGLVPVGFGATATAGTYAAGLAFLARDVVQDAAGKSWALVAIAVGGGVSWAMSTPALALASTSAFTLAELADFGVYTPLRRRGWALAVIASNAIGAVLDSIVFLHLAGFPVLANLGGQLVGKLLWATLIPVLAVIAVRRAVSR